MSEKKRRRKEGINQEQKRRGKGRGMEQKEELQEKE